MKKDLHPTYYADATVTCACGNTFSVGSTVKELATELCSKCHPFYTGTQKLVDTARRVDRFKQRTEAASAAAKGRATRKVKLAKKAAVKSQKKKATSATPDEA